MSDPSLPVAGWYADPTGTDQFRWWDGQTWTAHVRPKSAPAVEPLARSAPSGYVQFAQPLPPRSARPSAHYPGSTNTIAIWLIAVLPVLLTIADFIAFGGAFTLTVPLVILAAVTSLAAGIALVLWDNFDLTKRGAPVPSPLWFLLSMVAYVIARWVVMRKAGIKSDAPGSVYALSVFVSVLLTSLVLIPQVQAQGTVFSIRAIENDVRDTMLEPNLAPWIVECDETAQLTPGSSLNCTQLTRRA